MCCHLRVVYCLTPPMKIQSSTLENLHQHITLIRFTDHIVVRLVVPQISLGVSDHVFSF